MVARIDCLQPERIIDIGYGPGNSTQVLLERWPESEIIGEDNSPEMIRKATEDYPNQKWILFDGFANDINDKFDLVFSNSTIQWISDHDKLIQRFANLLNDSGVLAVKLPLFFDMSLGMAVSEIGRQSKWRAVNNGVDNIFKLIYHHIFMII